MRRWITFGLLAVLGTGLSGCYYDHHHGHHHHDHDWGRHGHRHYDRW